jgi:hypothetical protein
MENLRASPKRKQGAPIINFSYQVKAAAFCPAGRESMKRVSVASVHDWFFLAAKALEAGFRIGLLAKGNESVQL